MKVKISIVSVLCLVLLTTGCSNLKQTKQSRLPQASSSKSQDLKSGKMVASFYGRELEGQKTASGEKFQSKGLTAAHRSFPFGTVLRVTNKENSRSVNVRVNDRGPFIAGRDLDLSSGAAAALGIKDDGVATVYVEQLPDSPV